MAMMEMLLNHGVFKARNKLLLIRTFLLFNIILTLCGRSSAECEGHRKGDKWFDGCRWCLCQGERTVCTICQVQGLQLQPCKNIDAIWYDGAYQCICRRDGIHCRIGFSLAALLSSNEIEWRNELDCSAFESQECICGLDGVPSCSTQVIDRSKTNVKTLFLYPRFAASTEFERVKVFRHKARRSLLSLLLESYNSKSTDSNKRLLKISRENNHLEDRINGGDYIQRSTSNIITVTSNRCWQGSRWYGGGLRCYCDHTSKSITCGDPSFVATKVDGIRLQPKHCVKDTIWEEETSCRSCTCLVDGVVYCNRSSLCPFPKIITPDQNNVDIDEETGEMTGGEVELWDNWPPDTTLGIDSVDWIPLDTTNQRSDTTTGTINTIQKTINTTQSYFNNTGGRTNGSGKDKSNASVLVTIRECRPGTMKMKKCQHCICDMNGRFQCENSTCKSTNRNVTSPVSRTSRPDITRPVSQTSRTDVTSRVSHTSRPDVTSPVSQTSRPDVTSPFSHTSRPYVTSPVSQTSTPDVTSPTLSTNQYYSRQFRTLRPYTVIPGNRDYAITYKPQDTSCGEYQLNEEYKVDCNVCVCTIVGPKCTAKNCVKK